ncbi:Next to BRCA1 protein 1 protein [Phytophthora pseudosyringae]|uniref:Next to BRCA1 protein 1 protein n=1 Tax=Phytophthora pseudosyringae TaxID=221518 RepID=A0A8T1V1Z2_9STRA|nr:Next to BRCA1 protein 1 protein [Phytophthora pseudosyringae]
MTTRTLGIKTTDAELQQTLLLTTEDGQSLTMSQLQTSAASLLPGQEFSLRYTDADGDHVTIASDADLKELDKYLQDEGRHSLELLAVPQEPATAQRAATVVQTQLRGLVTAMSKLQAKPETKPTPASAMNLLVASLQAVDVADDAEELATIKKELLLLLQDETLRTTVEELGDTEEFKELADAMVAAIYEEDAQAIEDTATARFDELLVFAQRVAARCPSLKPVLVNVAKSLMTGLVRYNDDEMDGNAPDSTGCSSSSSCCSDDQETVGVEVLAEEVPLHLGVGCDGCEKAPLVGVRYKSLEVPNFDLCEECEASGWYTRYEPFVKITDPSRAPKQKRSSELLQPCATCDGCEVSPIVGVRFKSQTKGNFDLCEACEASGKWAESHGPFTKVDAPAVTRALKFTCRRGGKFGRQFGHRHHGHEHHGKVGHHRGKFEQHHDCHGPFGRPDGDGDDHRGKFGRGEKHDKDKHGKFGRHGHRHGPPGFPPFHGRHPDPRCPLGFVGHGFPGHGFPFQHQGRPDKFPGHGRRGFHSHHGLGSPSEFAFDARRHHHGSGFPECFGRFGPPPFDFADPRGPPMSPRAFEHGRPPFPAQFEHWGHPRSPRHHGRHGRHTRFADDVDEDNRKEEGRCYRRPHGSHGCGRGHWGRGATNDEAAFAHESHETEVKVSTDEEMEVVDTTKSRAPAVEDATEDKAEALTQLVSMGFHDTKKNMFALKLAGGNVGGAVNALLSE